MPRQQIIDVAGCRLSLCRWPTPRGGRNRRKAGDRRTTGPVPTTSSVVNGCFGLLLRTWPKVWLQAIAEVGDPSQEIDRRIVVVGEFRHNSAKGCRDLFEMEFELLYPALCAAQSILLVLIFLPHTL